MHDLPDLVDVPGLAVRRHAHDLVLALVHLEAEERGEAPIQQPERMREAHLLRELDGRCPIPSPIAVVVHSPTPSIVRIGRLVEWRAEERAGRVREVMLDEQDLVGRHAECRPDDVS